MDINEGRGLGDEHRRVLEEAVQFDLTVAELSANFVNLPAEQTDDAIRDAQRRILEALDLDRPVVDAPRKGP